ncbi:MAG: peptidylprolyl isomerase [Nanoarchaeota archaeon]|nr:peptidylprolyl isomerase [Nanoarchaeota archaeon]
MKKKKSKINQKVKSAIFTAVLAIIVISLFYYLIAKESSNNQSEDSSSPVAIVNGGKITENDLDKEYSKISEEYQALVSKDQLLDQLINKKLVLQEANNQDILVSDSEIEEQLNIVKQQFPTEELFMEALEQQGLTLEIMGIQIEETILINKLLNQTVISDIEVSEQEISEYYTGNNEQFTAKEGEIRVAHILAESEEEAGEIISILKNGRNFQDLAQAVSKDPSAEFNKGDLGFFSQGTMVAEFEDEAFSLKVGQISEPVKTEFGYHIIKRLPNIISLNEAKDGISAVILNSKQSESIEGYISELRDNADIKLSEEIAPLGAAIQEETEIENEFKETSDEICTEDEKPIIRMYTSSTCEKCRDIEIAFRNTVQTYDVVVKEWELDTGDNLYTSEIETSMTSSEYELLKKYNPSFAVPAYVFGCRYVRIGNAFAEPDYLEEEKIFMETIERII